MSLVTINGITLDTQAHQPVFSDTLTDSKYVLIEPNRPLTAADKTELKRQGVSILEGVRGGAIICWYAAPDLDRIRSLPFVAWADHYPDAVKLSPGVLRLPHEAGGVSAARAWAARPAKRDAERVTVDVVLHRHADVAAAAKRVAQAAQVDAGALAVSGESIRLTLQRRRLADVASVDDVRHVDRIYKARLTNSVARAILRAPPVSSTGTGPSGRGEVICVADTGFDTGSATDVHPAFKGRVKKLYDVARPGRTDDPDGHGTHVAGSALGNGKSPSEGTIQGTAPRAKLVLQSLLGPTELRIPADIKLLLEPPYSNDKARIHTNSWMLAGAPGQYVQHSRDADDFIYQHRDLVVCFSAGNDGRDSGLTGTIDPGSICAPGTAKNCLTVGASENLRPTVADTWKDHSSTGFGEPIRSDPVANNAEGMAAISSRGPTSDGRFKPDVVAPGSYVLSARSRKTASTGWALSSDTLYMYDGGTSMATPLVAGCAAVVREFLRKTHKIRSPSAALVKALLINGAHALQGQYVPSEAEAVPNNAQGFGRVDLQAVIGPYQPHESLRFFDEDQALDTGDRKDRVVKVTATTSRLKVTLVWTDPSGESLQSDLDLIVSAGGQTRNGNQPAGAATFDRTNNVEQVTWDGVPAGPATISVVAHSIVLAPQSYALVIRRG